MTLEALPHIEVELGFGSGCLKDAAVDRLIDEILLIHSL